MSYASEHWPEDKSEHDPSPHARYKHVFVVVRLRKTEAVAEAKEDDVMLTKAFFKQGDAENEAMRLNEVNQEFWRYFVCVARLVDDGPSEPR